MIKLIVGLGNPGKEYENTYHNLGFLCLEELEKSLDKSLIWKKTKKYMMTETIVDGVKVMIMKPLTFMNLSGEAIEEVKSFYKLKPEEILVISDDIDLPAGKIRYRLSGSAGTHNGLRNIVCKIGENFSRIRIGTGRKDNMDLADFVLSKINGEDKLLIEKAISDAVTKITELLRAE